MIRRLAGALLTAFGATVLPLPAAAFDLEGHRGARGLAPENTLAAFRHALAIGVTTLETDLAVTRDDVLVISHEPYLNPDLVRGADGRWLAAKGPTIRSLTLAELPTACLSIETANNDTMKAAADGPSPWTAGLDLAKFGNSVPRLVRAAGCTTWSPFWRNATPPRIAEAHALGLDVLPWTVNEKADMAALVDAGVDGLITDYPDRLREVLKAKGAPLPD